MAEMSETSSDAELSCDWIIVSKEGSDIETLASEATVDYGSEPLEREEAQMQDTEAECREERRAYSLDDTAEFPVDETPCVCESRSAAAGTQHVAPLSSSDHSDIVTLDDLKDDEEEEAAVAAANEELYLGMSCSSQYAFIAADTVFSNKDSAVANSSSSSDDDEGRSSGTVVRRRRLRRSTVTEPEEEREQRESGLSDELEEVQQEGPAAFRNGTNEQSSSFLNCCIVLALIMAVSMGFGHFQVATADHVT